MRRHEQREHIFKLLFRVEFNTPEEMPEQVRLFLNDVDMVFSEEDAEYITNRFKKIQDKIPEIDQMINERTEGWDTTRMGKVELTVLRVAVYEIIYDEDIPDGVAIDEAVEIAKVYGQKNSGGFVNAILAKFIKLGD